MGSLDGARSLALLAATRPTRVGGLIAISPWAKGLATTTELVVESLEQTLAELIDYPNADLLRLWAPTGWTTPCEWTASDAI
jgi:pimeloyl-ACP methyl ester carboxylesterase